MQQVFSTSISYAANRGGLMVLGDRGSGPAFVPTDTANPELEQDLTPPVSAYSDPSGMADFLHTCVRGIYTMGLVFILFKLQCTSSKSLLRVCLVMRLVWDISLFIDSDYFH